MIQYFQAAERHDVDAYVVDYSEQTHKEQGVEILYSKPKDIYAFHLSNPNHYTYWAVNFEKHSTFFQGESNCECMFATIRTDHRRRVALFVELKYCKEKNIPRNASEALSQLINTQKLIKERGCIDNKYNVFLNIAIPEHSHKEPFTAFILTPNDIKKVQDELNVIILGYNQVVILTPSYIKLPREDV